MDAELNDLINQGLETLEKMKPLLDLVDGYRAECERRGYSPEEARMMGIMFHNAIMLQQATPQAPPDK